MDVYAVGSDDDTGHYLDMDSWVAASELRQLWEAHLGGAEYRPTMPEIQNAESYAAAALEFYFLHHCQ